MDRDAWPAPPQLLDRALGAYLGLACGDALGATVEFMTPREITHRFAREGGVHDHVIGGGWLKLAPGQVTDDTTMSLALGDALLEGERRGTPLAPALVAEHFVRWWRGRPVDCGNTCRRGIQRYLSDGSLQGLPNEGDGGNGALMRNLPAALATLGDDDAFERIALAQARLTHHHPLSDAAVLGIGHLTRWLLAGMPMAQVRERLAAWLRRWPVFAPEPYRGRASGYVVDTVQTVLHAFLRFEDAEAAVVWAVNRGEDADTNGALVGMLAGARGGVQAVPARWRQRLDGGTVRAVTDQASALLAAALARPARERAEA